MRQIKRYGHVWTQKYDTWETTIDNKFHCMTWKFGSIWQCHINAPTDKTSYEVRDWHYSLGVRIGLKSTDAYYKSMKKAVEWVENYKKTGPSSWEELCRNCYNNYPTLYKRESDVIKHVFFCGGNGYSWLDGYIICEHPEDRSQIFNQERESSFSGVINLIDGWDEETKEKMPSKIMNLYERYKEEQRLRDEEDYYLKRVSEYPLPEPPLIQFSDYLPIGSGNIFTIPDCVSDEYLVVCARAWDMFRWRNANEKISEEIKVKHYETFHKIFKSRLEALGDKVTYRNVVGGK